MKIILAGMNRRLTKRKLEAIELLGGKVRRGAITPPLPRHAVPVEGAAEKAVPTHYNTDDEQRRAFNRAAYQRRVAEREARQ